LLLFQLQSRIIALLKSRWSAPFHSQLLGAIITAAKGCSNSHPQAPSPQDTASLFIKLASDLELSDFLKNAEKKAFKRAYYHVRDEEAALDIVQDSMIKLCTNYADKPLTEIPLLFQRILSNTVLDWFRRRKTRSALFLNRDDFEIDENPGYFESIDILKGDTDLPSHQSAEIWVSRMQTVAQIEKAVMNLPARQREAFLLRYWEELDVSETAAVMGCSEGSVKTHCSRAILALSKTLSEQGMNP